MCRFVVSKALQSNHLRQFNHKGKINPTLYFSRIEVNTQDTALETYILTVKLQTALMDLRRRQDFWQTQLKLFQAALKEHKVEQQLCLPLGIPKMLPLDDALD